MKNFKCNYCGNIRDVSLWKEISSFHLFGKKVFVKCPRCSKRNWMKLVKKEEIK